MNSIEEFAAGLLELVHHLVIADFKSKCVEYFKTVLGFQIVFDIEQ